MDYLIEEVARLPGPRPFLQLLGAMDESSEEILRLGRRLLGAEGFAAKSVPYDRVFEYYRAADVFVLASLREGFGRVYLEALVHGLPVIAQFNAITEYVLGSCGILGDLRWPGVLARFIAEELRKPADSKLMRARWQSVHNRFSWPVLAPAYRAMFQTCASKGRLPGLGVPSLPGKGRANPKPEAKTEAIRGIAERSPLDPGPLGFSTLRASASPREPGFVVRRTPNL
jgi:glycosyltransferase involved in cell wall biosynthesis